jgi:UDP-N-acetylglucosamine diphosphorylase / glucose-1-phosphate thymidylyltransferase / UDP-N-acetylgalactosamine diphosphorylase / glucosamine-1-phosphate N-acetyltransferase / galactosamine-1-phosphate N-acetyltransferase
MLLLFEDHMVERLSPLNYGKPTYALSCAAERLVDLVRKQTKIPVRAWVRPHLRELEAADYPEICLGDHESSGKMLLVNARLVPAVTQIARLEKLYQSQEELLLYQDETLVAALLHEPRGLFQVPVANWLATLRARPQLAATHEPDWDLFVYPHDVVRLHQKYLPENLAERLRSDNLRQTQDGLFVGDNVTLGAHLTVETSKGPVIIEADSTLGPFCFLRGPLYLGRGARINEHAALKDGTCLAHTTKVGGEVECSILEPYSNKQHHGFLGHSYVGSWVNLGAGTSNSDLKNTYGTVNMLYGTGKDNAVKVNTGMQFIGCMIGDYAKTAINTSIFTGKTIGACSMVYGFVTGNVPSFVNYARSFGQVTEAPVEVMISTQKRMFARRGREQRPCDIALLREMYELTRDERANFGEPLTPEPLSW